MDEKEKRGETIMGDYVDRSELFHKMRTIYREEGNVMIPHRVVTYSDLILTPAADVAPVVHGHWIAWAEKFPQSEAREGARLGVFCSACEMHADNKYTHCPNCGAKMDKEPPKEE